MIEIINEDCFVAMDILISKKMIIDAIIVDPPYGTTACKWDTIIPFDGMWERIHKLIKPNGAIIIFGSEPFSSNLRMSNIKEYKYDWVWIKNTSSGMMLAGKAPMKRHENISVFYAKQPTFNPQKILGSLTSQNHSKKGYKYTNNTSKLYNVDGGVEFVWSEYINPHSVLPCNSVGNRDKEKIHSTQKPVALLEYLINTYTNKNELILDFACGSASTLIAAMNTERNAIGIDNDTECYLKAKERIEKHTI